MILNVLPYNFLMIFLKNSDSIAEEGSGNTWFIHENDRVSPAAVAKPQQLEIDVHLISAAAAAN